MHKRPGNKGQYRTLGEFRSLAIEILTDCVDIPDRATIFVNPAGNMNINWKSDAEEELILTERKAQLKFDRTEEAIELKRRLAELKLLGIE